MRRHSQRRWHLRNELMRALVVSGQQLRSRLLLAVRQLITQDPLVCFGSAPQPEAQERRVRTLTDEESVEEAKDTAKDGNPEILWGGSAHLDRVGLDRWIYLCDPICGSPAVGSSNVKRCCQVSVNFRTASCSNGRKSILRTLVTHTRAIP